MPYPKYFLWLYDTAQEAYYRTNRRYQSITSAKKRVQGLTHYEIRDAVNHTIEARYPHMSTARSFS